MKLDHEDWVALYGGQVEQFPEDPNQLFPGEQSFSLGDEPGLLDTFLTDLDINPFYKTMILIKAMSDEEILTLLGHNPDLYQAFMRIKGLDPFNIRDLEELILILKDLKLKGYRLTSILRDYGVPEHMIRALYEAIMKSTLSTTTAANLLAANNAAVDNQDYQKMPVGVKKMADNYFIPTCNPCYTGWDLSITIYFRGLGDKGKDGKVFAAEKIVFLGVLASKAKTVTANECCRKMLFAVNYDHTKTARQNADHVIAYFNNYFANIISNPDFKLTGLRKIFFHLIGYSAGGIVAINTAESLPCHYDALGRVWCGRRMPDQIPVSIDIMTIASPLNLGSPGAGAGTGFCKFFGSKNTLGCSIGKSDCGGQPPECLCNFTAIVTDPQSDTTPGGGKDPQKDSRLEGWNPQSENSPGVNHLGVLNKALQTQGEQLKPKCGCSR